MSLDELIAIVPPPVKPHSTGDVGDWKKIVKSLGIALPPDYLDFAMRYGTGRFCEGHITIYNPFDARYRETIDFECKVLRDTKLAGLHQPYDVFPENPGLFPWGRDENGNSMYWHTVGSPDKWPIVLKSHQDVYESWDKPVTSFLAEALANKLRTAIWDRFRKTQLSFAAE